MKKFLSCCLLFLTSIVTGCYEYSYYPQFDLENVFHNFERNTFSSMTEITKEFAGVGQVGRFPSSNGGYVHVAMNLTKDNYGYMIIVKYLGGIRPIPPAKRNVLNRAFKEAGVYSGLRGLYKDEIYLEADSKKYWIPIQESLVGFWEEEVARNDSAAVFLRIYGAMEADEENKWIFAINGFYADEETCLWNEAIKYFEAGYDTIGIMTVKKLMEIAPDDGRNYAMLGFHYSRVAKDYEDPKKERLFQRADSMFATGIQLTPGYGYQYFQSALLYYYWGKYPLAWKMIDIARESGVEGIEQRFLTDLEESYPYEKYLTDDAQNVNSTSK